MDILALTYLGNIQWFSKLCFSRCVIDIHEHYVKQSYRNRCDILTANGPTALTVNTVKTSNWDKVAVKDIRIDYSKRWQHMHWQSLVSSYRSSPYFDHYAPDLETFYTSRFDFLLDFNAGLLETVLRLIGSDAKVRFSESYIDPATDDMSPERFPKIDSSAMPGMTPVENLKAETSAIVDWRAAISPKPRLAKPDVSFCPEPYWQVFSDRMDFVPNLSVIDLLFCEGPQTLDIIRNSIKQMATI